jgi:alpha-ketoglutarate-dependent taurine dioxygenase
MTKVRRLNPAIGAEMTGVDLAGPIGDNLFNEIRQAWNEA